MRASLAVCVAVGGAGSWGRLEEGWVLAVGRDRAGARWRVRVEEEGHLQGGGQRGRGARRPQELQIA